MDGLAEAYELCQEHSSLIAGGMVWLKMTNVIRRTIVDLSGLGLDQIEETGEEFRIGCMSTLHQVETHQGLNQYFGGMFRECTRHTVGVQIRNCTTVGGSIYGRFGLPDVLTCMMALDTYAELYHEGIMPLSEFAKGPVRRGDKDILARVIIKRGGHKTAYTTQRNSGTDFPLLTCCVSRRGGNWYVAVGARPSKAQMVTITDGSYDSLAQLAREVVDPFTHGTNTRGSSRYRRQLASIHTRRPMECLTGGSVTIG